jgi:predicted negative regulator of RcsB-dependent stress response
MENQEVPQTTASVVQPESAASELAALKDIAGGNSTLTVVLALIAVVGGGAGWKFWNQRAKLKHEEEMKKLEIEAEVARSKAKAAAFKEKVKSTKKSKE